MIKTYYYIEKEGIYPQGVSWVGEHRLEGMVRVRKLAREDEDSYHNWVLYKYCCGNISRIYETTKEKEETK